jgi:hypothetical protein
VTAGAAHVAAVAEALWHRHLNPDPDRRWGDVPAWLRATYMAQATVAVETLTPLIRMEGWVPFGTHAPFDGIPVVLSDETDETGPPMWERIDTARIAEGTS